MKKLIQIIKNKLELIIAIISILLAVYFYLDSVASRELVIQTNEKPTLIADSKQATNTGIKVTRIDGSELIDKVWVQPVVIWNPGKLSVKQEHILKPVILFLDTKDAELLSFRIAEQIRPEVSKAELTTSSKNSIRLTFKVLENKDAIYAQVTYMAKEPVKIMFSGDIEGVQNISASPPKDWISLPFSLIKIIFYISSFYIGLWALGFCFERIGIVYRKLGFNEKYLEYLGGAVGLIFLLALFLLLVSFAIQDSNPKPPTGKSDAVEKSVLSGLL